MNRSRLNTLAWATLAYNLFVIAWGAFVRATGSGAGCGSNWPTCNGEVVPRSPGIETLIEYTHRLTSGFALVLVVLLVVWARSLYPAGHRVRKAAYASLVLILVEAGIGAGLVLLELVADNSSMARAGYMAVHLANTFFLLGALTLTAHFTSERAPAVGPLLGERDEDPADDGPAATARHPETLPGARKLRRGFWTSVAAMLVVGVSGAIAALGDTLFPAESLLHGLQQDLSPTSHLLVQLRVFHPFLAFAASVVLLSFVGAVRKAKKGEDTEGARQAKIHATRLNLLVLIQLAAGGINIVLLAPIWMQLVHLLLADLMWIALVLTGLTCLAVEPPVSAETRPAPDPERADPPPVRA